MKNVVLEGFAKEELVKEFGEKAIVIDQELNQLSKLIIKRKDTVKALNKGAFSPNNKKRYYEVNEEIKKVVQKINRKLASL